MSAGETLLVLGAGGGVGLAAVELGKAMGARVIAAASSPEKLALAREHGADERRAIPAGPLDKNAARALTDASRRPAARRARMSFTMRIGGDYSEAALRAIAWDGRHLVVGFTAGIPKLPLNLPLAQGLRDRRRVLGRVHPPQSRAACGQRGRAHGAVSGW